MSTRDIYRSQLRLEPLEERDVPAILIPIDIEDATKYSFTHTGENSAVVSLTFDLKGGHW